MPEEPVKDLKENLEKENPWHVCHSSHMCGSVVPNYIFCTWVKELGEHKETIFQSFNYIGQGHPLLITEYKPKTTREGDSVFGIDDPNYNPTPFTTFKRDQCVESLLV